MASYLITGSSRGIGLELGRQLAAKPATDVGKFFATARSLNAPLQEQTKQHPGRVAFVQIDVTDKESIRDAAKTAETTLNDKEVDGLINIARVVSWSSVEEI